MKKSVRASSFGLSLLVVLGGFLLAILLDEFVSRKAIVWLSFALLLLPFFLLLLPREKRNTSWFWALIIFLPLGGVAGLLFYGMRFDFVADVFSPFWVPALVIAVIGGAVFSVFLRYIKVKLLARIGAFVLVLFLVFLVAVAILSNLNYVLDFSEPVCEPVLIVNKDFSGSLRGPTRHYFKVQTKEGVTLRVEVSAIDYAQYQIGDSYEITYYNGAFGEPFYLAE